MAKNGAGFDSNGASDHFTSSGRKLSCTHVLDKSLIADNFPKNKEPIFYSFLQEKIDLEKRKLVFKNKISNSFN